MSSWACDVVSTTTGMDSRSSSAFSSASTSSPLRRGGVRGAKVKPGGGARDLGIIAGLAQEVHGLLAVTNDVQVVAYLIVLEGLPGHQHVTRVVFDQ